MRRRVPARVQIGRFFRMVLPAAVILIGGVLGVFGFLVYRITHPSAVPEPVNPSHYLLPSLEVAVPAGEGSGIPGWWIPGLKGAPGIILVAGYGMGRPDALSLASTLHRDGFNLLIYDQPGNGASPRGPSTLGLHETDDMLAVLSYMKSRLDPGQARLGIWAVDVSARVALQAAASVTEVRAIAADGAFEFVSDFIDLRIADDFGSDSALLQFGCRQLFRLIHIADAPSINEKLPLQALSGRSILFIQGENRKGLARLTTALYEEIQPQKEMVSLKAARVHVMSDEDIKSYDRQVANFFHLNLR